MGDTTNAVPPPGSDEALSRGCTCPVMDNSHGKGWPGSGQFWITEGCPLHHTPHWPTAAEPLRTPDAHRAAGEWEAGAEAMREAAAKVADDDSPLTECPYGNDKPGDPTWGHTDEDICPVCRKNGHDSLHTCLGNAKARIAKRIRALPLPPAPKAE